MKKCVYMHTINGYPASYNGEQICYATKTRSFPVNLVKDLKQIKKEQKLSIQFRHAHGWEAYRHDYGWVLVEAK